MTTLVSQSQLEGRSHPGRKSFLAVCAGEIREGFCIVKNSGFRELVRRKGKKVIIAIVAYYLIRDSILYLVIPYCIANKLFF